MEGKRPAVFQQLSIAKGCNPFTFGCGTFILCTIGLFVVSAIFIGITTPGTTTDWHTNNHQTLRIPTERGIQETVHIDVGSSISGKWATQGLDLTLDGPANDVTGAVPEKGPDWSEQISVQCPGNGACPTGEEMILDGTFTVPYVEGPVSQTVTGHIAGTVYWPHDLGNGTFDTKSTDVDVVVQLVLGTLSPYDAFMRGPDGFADAAWLSFGLGALLALMLAIRFHLFLRRQFLS
ncbi:MAG TPA: hypothetical protein VKR06_34520 [Ktedonosporobacter sp.]|nr:hypothetical protein [Ktedonosporobacter sp.]